MGLFCFVLLLPRGADDDDDEGRKEGRKEGIKV